FYMVVELFTGSEMTLEEFRNKGRSDVVEVEFDDGPSKVARMTRPVGWTKEPSRTVWRPILKGALRPMELGQVDEGDIGGGKRAERFHSHLPITISPGGQSIAQSGPLRRPVRVLEGSCFFVQGSQSQRVLAANYYGQTVNESAVL